MPFWEVIPPFGWPCGWTHTQVRACALQLPSDLVVSPTLWPAVPSWQHGILRRPRLHPAKRVPASLLENSEKIKGNTHLDENLELPDLVCNAAAGFHALELVVDTAYVRFCPCIHGPVLCLCTCPCKGPNTCPYKCIYTRIVASVCVRHISIHMPIFMSIHMSIHPF